MARANYGAAAVPAVNATSDVGSPYPNTRQGGELHTDDIRFVFATTLRQGRTVPLAKLDADCGRCERSGERLPSGRRSR